MLLPFGVPLCYYCSVCLDKHKHAVPQTIISEVIETSIGIEKFFD